MLQEDVIDFDPKFGGPLAELLAMDAPRRAVAKDFQHFLETWTVGKQRVVHVYIERIKVCSNHYRLIAADKRVSCIDDARSCVRWLWFAALVCNRHVVVD
jgi:hypothetical protein